VVEEILPTIPEPEVQDNTQSAPRGIIHPIPLILPGREVHILSGSSGAGKTSLVGWLVARLLSDQSLFGHPCSELPFIAYLSGDRVLDDALEKFDAAGWKDAACYGLINDHGSDVDAAIDHLTDRRRGKNAAPGPDRFSLLWRALESLRARYYPTANRLPEDSLLIVDGMSMFTGIEPAGSYLKQVAAPLTLLSRWAWANKFTLLLIHHSGKQVGDAKARYVRPQDRILGSMALQGFTSTQMFLTEPELTECPERGLYELTIRSHRAPVETRNLCRDGKTGVFRWADPLVMVPPRKVHIATVEVHIPKPALAILEHVPANRGPIAKTALHYASKQTKPTFYRNLAILLDANKLEEIILDNVPCVRLPLAPGAAE